MTGTGTGTGTGTRPPVDHGALLWDEVADIGDLLDELGDADLDTASLCAGWRVRDVIGHMGYGHLTPLRTIVADLVRFRGDLHRASLELSRRFADDHTAAELRGRWHDELVVGHTR